MTDELPKPPKHLSKEAKRLWDEINREWELDSAGLLILQAGLEAYDRMEQARRLIEKQGLTVVDKYGQVKMNPLVQVERDSRGLLLRCFKALNLDIEPLHDRPGRPGG